MLEKHSVWLSCLKMRRGLFSSRNTNPTSFLDFNITGRCQKDHLEFSSDYKWMKYKFYIVYLDSFIQEIDIAYLPYAF